MIGRSWVLLLLQLADFRYYILRRWFKLLFRRLSARTQSDEKVGGGRLARFLQL
jgi:hypothetical protein